jgi:hypothetical protein
MLRPTRPPSPGKYRGGVVVGRPSLWVSLRRTLVAARKGGTFVANRDWIGRRRRRYILPTLHDRL